MKSIYDNSNVRKWSEIPFEWRLVQRVGKVNVKSFAPTDKEFVKVFKSFASTDTLRPAMTGVNYDENGLCITDAHRLVYFPKSKYSEYFKGTKDGIYELGSGKKIDE